jgi:hypothetical protein
MGLHVLEFVVAGRVLGVADDLQDHQVAAVGKNEGLLLPEGGVEPPVELEAVLEDELVLDPAGIHAGEGVAGGKFGQDRRFHPHEIAADIGRPDLQTLHLAKVADGRDPFLMVDLQEGTDKGFFDSCPGLRVEIGNQKQVVFFEHPAGDAQLFRH